MSGAIFIGYEDVARRLEISAACFRRQEETLRDQWGFPEPMPWTGPNGRTVWRAAQVDAWLAAQPARPTLDPAALTGTNVTLLEEARRA